MSRFISACCIVLLFVGKAASQTGFDPPKIEPFGIDGFRLMLQQKGLDTVQVRLASAMQAPEQTVIVLLGNLRDAQRITQGLTRFVREGGSLLVATDLGGPEQQGTKRLRWLEQSEFRSVRMSFSRDSRLNARYSDCPLITEFDTASEPDLFAGVQALAANRPGHLKVSKHVRGVAWLPKTTSPSMESAALVASSHVGKGRMLLVADHSIFINEMLIYADNARFASNVATWLTADGNRKQLVVCLDNGLLPEWSFVGTPPTIPLKTLLRRVEQNGLAGLPTGEALLPMLNQSLVDFERQGGFNQLLRKVAGSSRSRGSRNLQKPLIFVAMLLLLMAARWLVISRASAQRWLFPRAHHQIGETRLTAAVKEQNRLPVLRALIREFFAEAGVTRFADPKNYPVVRWQDSVHARKSKTAEVRALWAVATRAPRGRMSSKKMQMLAGQLRGLYQLHANGHLTLE